MKKNAKKEAGELLRKVRNDIRRRSRDARRKHFQEVLDKGKFETYLDLFYFVNGLKPRQIKNAAYFYIYEQAQFFRNTPKEILSKISS